MLLSCTIFPPLCQNYPAASLHCTLDDASTVRLFLQYVGIHFPLSMVCLVYVLQTVFSPHDFKCDIVQNKNMKYI